MVAEDILIHVQTFTTARTVQSGSISTNLDDVDFVLGFDFQHVSTSAHQESGTNAFDDTFQLTVVYISTGGSADPLNFKFRRFKYNRNSANNNEFLDNGDIVVNRESLAGLRVVRFEDTVPGQDDEQNAIAYLGEFGASQTGVTYRIISKFINNVSGTTPPPIVFVSDNDDTTTDAGADTKLTTIAGDNNGYYVFGTSVEQV